MRVAHAQQTSAQWRSSADLQQPAKRPDDACVGDLPIY
jgi:hypothetical protein